MQIPLPPCLQDIDAVIIVVVVLVMDMNILKFKKETLETKATQMPAFW